MKQVLFLLFFLPISIFAQSDESNDSVAVEPISPIEQILENTQRLVLQNAFVDGCRGHYKMYKTENMYVFLKLNTSTGQIELVQWSLDYEKEFSIWLNSTDLSTYSDHSPYSKIGRFELYPTNNIYQFILLDTTDGRTWHVQWGTESKKQWIRRIY